MRHADLATLPTRPTAPASATRPAAGPAADGRFARALQALHADVSEFIRHGAEDHAMAGALSPQGAVLRLRAGGPRQDAGTPAQQAFLDHIAPWARQAAARLGVAPALVQAHAALESGWGRHPVRGADGASSHNLFGLKAGAGWDGATNEAATTEYVGGAARQARERFRAYPDAASAFDDYARLLLSNPRYRGALDTGDDAHAFARGLARGGYATDPAYAAKLVRIAASLQGGGE